MDGGEERAADPAEHQAGERAFHPGLDRAVGAAVKRLSQAWEKRGPGKANAATAHSTKSTIRVPASAIADAPGWSRNERVLSLVMAIQIVALFLFFLTACLFWLTITNTTAR